MIEASTKRCTRSGLLGDQVAARLDQSRIGVETLIGEQKDFRLESRLLLDRERLRRDVALHRAVLVGEERLRVEGVGLHLRSRRSRNRPSATENRWRCPPWRRTSVSRLRSSNFSTPASGCAISTCGSFWNMAATATVRNVLLDRVERLQRVGAHEEVELADRQQQPVVHVRAARHDGDVEAVRPIGAVGERLVEAAVLGLRHPVGAEGHLVERLRAARCKRQRAPQQRCPSTCRKAYAIFANVDCNPRRSRRRKAWPRH